MVWPPYKRAYEAAHMTVEEMDIKGTKLANDHTASGWWNLNVNLDRLQILYPSNPWSKLRKNEREKRRKEGKKEEDEREAGKERGSQEGNNAIPGDTEPLRAATRPSLHRLRHTVQCIFAPLLINGVLKPRCPNWIWYSASGFLMGRRILWWLKVKHWNQNAALPPARFMPKDELLELPRALAFFYV